MISGALDNSEFNNIVDNQAMRIGFDMAEERLMIQSILEDAKCGTYSDLKSDHTATESQLNTLENGHDQSKECPVCLNDFADSDIVYVVRCGHCAHDECLKGWLTNQLKRKEQPNCPVCRFVFVPLDQKNALPIY